MLDAMRRRAKFGGADVEWFGTVASSKNGMSNAAPAAQSILAGNGRQTAESQQLSHSGATGNSTPGRPWGRFVAAGLV